MPRALSVLVLGLTCCASPPPAPPPSVAVVAEPLPPPRIDLPRPPFAPQRETTGPWTIVLAGDFDDTGPIVVWPVVSRGHGWSDGWVGTLRGGARVRAYDGAGGVLGDRNVELGEVVSCFGPSAHPRSWMFLVALPELPDARRLVVTDEARVVLDARASAHRPTMRILAPEPDDLVDRERDSLRWVAHDADGDALTAQFSWTTDGETWHHQRVGAGTRQDDVAVFEWSLDSVWIRDGEADHVSFEVDVSDGFWTVHDAVGPIRMRDCAPPPDSAVPDNCAAWRYRG